MLLFFGLGFCLVLFCAVKVLWQHKRQPCAVLLVAYTLPVTRLEQALYAFARHCAKDYCRWYVYWPPAFCRSSASAINLLAGRWSFSLLSAGECRRLWLDQKQDYRFYFLSASGVFYRLPSSAKSDWQRLFVI